MMMNTWPSRWLCAWAFGLPDAGAVAANPSAAAATSPPPKIIRRLRRDGDAVITVLHFRVCSVAPGRRFSCCAEAVNQLVQQTHSELSQHAEGTPSAAA